MSFIKDYSNNVFSDSIRGRVRKANEDKCDWQALTDGGFFIVCDGMGGHVGGQKASELAVQMITEYLQRKESSAETPQELLYNALEYANTKILNYALENPEYKGMGTTACVLLLQNENAWIAHAGDSRIYLFLDNEKHIYRITKDHSYVQLVLVEKEGLSEDEAERDPRKNIIMKALGILENLAPEVPDAPVKPKKNDIFLICSDGLTGMISDETIEQVLADETLSLKEKGDKLILLANGETDEEGKGKDNITLQLIQIEESPYKESAFMHYNPQSRLFNRNNRVPEKKKKKKINLKKIIKVIVIILSILILLLGIRWCVIKKLEADINSLNTEIENYIKDKKKKNERIAELSKTIAGAKTTKEGEEITREGEKNKNNTSFQDKIIDLQNSIIEIQNEVKKIEIDSLNTKNEIDKKQTLINKLKFKKDESNNNRQSLQ